jgi:hypothetical protein
MLPERLQRGEPRRITKAERERRRKLLARLLGSGLLGIPWPRSMPMARIYELDSPADKPLLDFGREFDSGGEKEARMAEAYLLALLRAIGTEASNMMADMIDPTGESYWRLKLQKRHRGKPRQMSSAETEYLVTNYVNRLKELKERGRASPAKTARGDVAKRYKMTDEEVRAIVDRAQGKRVRKRATPKTGRKIAPPAGWS